MQRILKADGQSGRRFQKVEEKDEKVYNVSAGTLKEGFYD